MNSAYNSHTHKAKALVSQFQIALKEKDKALKGRYMSRGEKS